MNLYLISQTENNDYDTYSDAVVAAKSAKTAKQIHPSGRWSSSTWCGSPKGVTAVLIGKAKKGTKEGIICASFHAG